MILISTDMEGLCGITRWAEVTPGSSEYHIGRAALLKDLSAVVDVYKNHGQDVRVVDGHWFGTNLDAGQINVPIKSGTRRPYGMVDGVQQKNIEGVLLLGYHGRAGSPGVMAHTWSESLVEVRLDGVPIGESALSALLSLSVGVPVIGLSGDNVVVEEMRSSLIVPALQAEFPMAAVKRAIGHEAADHRWDAQIGLRAMATESLALVGRREPLKPVEHEIAATMNSRHADQAAILPGTVREGGGVLRFTGPIKHCFDAMRSWAALAEA